MTNHCPDSVSDEGTLSMIRYNNAAYEVDHKPGEGYVREDGMGMPTAKVLQSRHHSNNKRIKQGKMKQR